VGFVTVKVVAVAPETLVNPEPVLTCHWTVGAGFPLAAAVKDAFAPYVIDAADGFAVTAGAVQEEPTAKLPLPVEESAGRAAFVALTVNDVEPEGVAAVVAIVSVEVLEASPAAKLTVAGLNEAVAPVGSAVVTLTFALKAALVPAARLIVTVYVALPGVPLVRVPVCAPTVTVPTCAMATTRVSLADWVINVS
jgi:hypothetical protein